MAREKTRAVTVRVSHRTSRAHTVWVEPVGWEPQVGQLGPEVVWADGAAWDDEEEVAGIAAVVTDLGTDDPQEGDVCEVDPAELFWLSSGDCRFSGRVEMA